MTRQYLISINTSGRGLTDVTDDVARFVAQSGVEVGLCHLFVQHTSASLLINENADPLVQSDLEAFFSRLVPDGDAVYQHVAEGPDDMPSHVRTALTHSSLSIPVKDQALALGRWQGVYLWEHRLSPHTRNILITII